MRNMNADDLIFQHSEAKGTQVGIHSHNGQIDPKKAQLDGEYKQA
jgi:hypothetical protein